MVQIALERVRQTAQRILHKSGYSPEETAIITEVLMYAQMRGSNQGIVKLIGAGLPRDPDCRPPAIVHQTPISARIDGGSSVGMVAAHYALTVALKLVRARGFALVGTFNTSSSTGAIGYYAGRAAQSGYVSFVFAGSGEYVAPFGSYQPLFGTNPLAVGFPTAGRPIVLDMATSAIARYGIIEAQTAGQPLPEGVAYDAAGHPTTDPTAALAGAIRAFGGHKGGGLALIVELLTGALVGTSRHADGRKADWGTLIMLIDPTLLTDREGFIERTQQVIGLVKGARRLPGVDEIFLPGERGDRLYEQVVAAGVIEIEERLWQALQAAAG